MNVYQEITDMIIQKMQQGVIPWHKTWNGTGCQEAISYVTRKPYSLLNQMLLCEEGEFLTFKQVKALGGTVNKGAKARTVVFYTDSHTKKVTELDDDGNEIVRTVTAKYSFPILKTYKVFNVKDTNLKSRLSAELNESNQTIMDAETIAYTYVDREDTLTLVNDRMQDQAYYMPKKDTVVMPMISQFTCPEEYYSTLFHELAHSTMLEKRCNRKKDNEHAHFGSAEYSREELVAEISSTMLCSVAGIKKSLDNNVAYLQAWIKFLNNDNKAIVYAAAKAEKATRYILNQ